MKKSFTGLLAGLIALATLSQSAYASTFTYRYDANNRLVAVLKDGYTQYVYFYDNNGNLLKRTKQGLTGTVTRVYHSTGISNTYYTAHLEWQLGFPPDSYNIYVDSYLVGTAPGGPTGTFDTKALAMGYHTLYVAPVINGVEAGKNNIGTVNIPGEMPGPGDGAM